MPVCATLLYNVQLYQACLKHLLRLVCLQGVKLRNRAIARILQGVASPAYPAAQWSKCGFWQQYANLDFDCIIDEVEQARS